MQNVSSRKVRILYIVTDLALGGTPRSVESLVMGLDRERYDPEVLTLMNSSPITDAISAAGIPCHVLTMRSKLDMPRLAKLPLLMARGGFDIVHAWLFHANILARMFKPLTHGARVITSERGVERNKSAWRVWVDRTTSPMADLVMTNANAIREVLLTREKLDPRRIRVIENGVDLSRFTPPPEPPSGPPRLICVARLDPIKAHKDLLTALKHLLPRWPDLSLDLVGAGPMKQPLEQQAHALGIVDRVRFLGGRTDVPQLLQAAHMFVLTSLSEGMPGSILEAMATALPVVATRVGGVPEIVDHERTGMLVPPGDPPALAVALGKLLSDPAKAREMGLAGLARAKERFTREAYIRRHCEVYEEIMKSPAR